MYRCHDIYIYMYIYVLIYIYIYICNCIYICTNQNAICVFWALCPLEWAYFTLPEGTPSNCLEPLTLPLYRIWLGQGQMLRILWQVDRPGSKAWVTFWRFQSDDFVFTLDGNKWNISPPWDCFSLYSAKLRPTESLRHPIKRMLTTCLSLRFPWLLVTEAEASFREVEHWLAFWDENPNREPPIINRLNRYPIHFRHFWNGRWFCVFCVYHILERPSRILKKPELYCTSFCHCGWNLTWISKDASPENRLPLENYWFIISFPTQLVIFWVNPPSDRKSDPEADARAAGQGYGHAVRGSGRTTDLE